MAGFSIHATKLMPSGEGGMFVTDERRCFERAVLLGHYERIKHLDDPDLQRFQLTGYGAKYRISAMHAALGRVALSKLDERNARRSGGVQYLYDQLAEISGTVPPTIPEHIEPVHFLRGFVLYEPGQLGGLPVGRFVEAHEKGGRRSSRSTSAGSDGLRSTFQLFQEPHGELRYPEMLISNSKVLLIVPSAPPDGGIQGTVKIGDTDRLFSAGYRIAAATRSGPVRRRDLSRRARRRSRRPARLPRTS